MVAIVNDRLIDLLLTCADLKCWMGLLGGHSG